MWIKMKQHHPYETLNYSGKDIPIDIYLIELMKKLWSLNIHTVASCQELPENAAIPKLINLGSDYSSRFTETT